MALPRLMTSMTTFRSDPTGPTKPDIWYDEWVEFEVRTKPAKQALSRDYEPVGGFESEKSGPPAVESRRKKDKRRNKRKAQKRARRKSR